jgi:hypothetical protein
MGMTSIRSPRTKVIEMVSTMERIMHVRESATIPKARVTIRTQPAGIVLNTETKILTSKPTGRASAAVTMKVISVTEVAMTDDPIDAPQIF